jgi:hypothetical protein
MWALNLTTHVWTRANQNGLQRRYSTTIPSTDGYTIVLFGGEVGDTKYNNVSKFDTDTRTWSTLSPIGILPAPRSYVFFHVCTTQHKIPP